MCHKKYRGRSRKADTACINDLTISDCHGRLQRDGAWNEIRAMPGHSDDNRRSPAATQRFDPLGHCVGHAGRMERLATGSRADQKIRLFRGNGALATGGRCQDDRARFQSPGLPGFASRGRTEPRAGFCLPRAHREVRRSAGLANSGRRGSWAGSSRQVVGLMRAPQWSDGS